jgi:hypothetical protein
MQQEDHLFPDEATTRQKDPDTSLGFGGLFMHWHLNLSP